MRIGLFSDTFPPDLNGVANSTYILFQELKKHGHDVYVVATRSGTGWASWNEEHDVLRLAGVTVKQLYGYAVTTPFHINALNEVRMLNLDVIHAQTEFGVGMFARICARQLNIPLVSTYHTSYQDYTHYINLLNSDRFDAQMKKAVAWFSRYISDSAVEVIAPSDKTRELLERYHVTSEINVVPTGLQLDRFSPKIEDKERTRVIRREFDISEQERLIIYVGRIAEEKALDLVIDGFGIAEKNGCPLRLLVVGGGPDLERLKKYTAEKGISNVLFAGPRPAAEVADYYRSADFFVSASLSETQGMTFVEAMASGLPLLARKDVVLQELLFDGETGWYFKDAADLAEKLHMVETMSEDALNEMKQRVIQQVQPLSSERFYERAINVYEKAIDVYENMLVIEDVQVKEDVVQIYVTNMKPSSDEDIRLIMSLDDYYNEGIRRGMRISSGVLERIRKKQDAVRAWRSCMRKIAVKDRTRKEIYDWLTRNTSCDIETINGIVEKLEAKGYIDDERYCVENISRMKVALFGKERMVRELRRKGIPSEMITDILGTQPDTEYEDALAYAKRAARTLPDTSVRMKQSKLRSKLIQKGYSGEIAEKVALEYDFHSDSMGELESLRKCAQKAKKRYEKKYSGTKLRNTVYRYCGAQGYTAEDIYVILDEMEWD